MPEAPTAEIDDGAWGFDLPEEQIARHPTPERTGSRLMMLGRSHGEPKDLLFRELPSLLRKGDLLIANDSRVMAARLFAQRPTGGAVEMLILSVEGRTASAIIKPARKIRPGMHLTLRGGGIVTAVGEPVDGIITLVFDREAHAVMAEQGRIPLPPYLARDADDSDSERYQTVYAGPLGSCAAPTAGLHFDEAMLTSLAASGITFRTVTLHVGIGTFRPPRPDDLLRGELHSEPYVISAETAAAVADTKAAGGRVIAVGTTSARTLESATDTEGRLHAGAGATTLFIRPPYRFRVIDGLLTNFHLPHSSLLMLVGALAGQRRILHAYTEAVRKGYRFYSYGDAMLIS